MLSNAYYYYYIICVHYKHDIWFQKIIAVDVISI